GKDNRTRNPVRIRITGDRWVELPAWPPPTSPQVLHLQPGGRLADSAPRDDARPSTFTYDPANPTPIVDAPLLAPERGCRADTTLTRRPDVLRFTGAPPRSDLYVVGTPVVELSHAADIPHVDLFVRVSEVNARGRSHNISDGYQRVIATPEPGRRVRIQL